MPFLPDSAIDNYLAINRAKEAESPFVDAYDRRRERQEEERERRIEEVEKEESRR